MIVLTVLAFLSTFLSMTIVIRALRLSARSEFTLTFALFVFCQGLWSFSYMMLYPATTPSYMNLWYSLSGFGWIPLHAAGTHFALVFTGHKRLLQKCWIYPLLYLPAIAFLYRHLTGTMVTTDLAAGPYGVYQAPALASPWFWAYFIYGIVSTAARVALMLSYHRESKDTVAGRQARFLAFADAGTFLVISTANYLVPAVFDAPVPSLGAVLITMMPLAVWYVIRSQRFLSYNLYFRFSDGAPAGLSSIYREIFSIESIFDAVENGVALVDNQYRVVRMNKVLEHWVRGWSGDRVAPCYTAVFGRAAPCRGCPLGRGAKDHQPQRDSIELSGTDGARRVCSRTMFAVREASGRTTGAIEILRDVTDEQRTEREHAYLLHAVENTPTQVIIAGVDGKTIYANRAFSNATGVSVEEVRGKPFWSVYVQTNPAHTINSVRNAVESGVAWQGAIAGRSIDGRLYPARMTITPMAGCKPRYVLAQVEDTTEEQRVRRLRADIERTVRHDLKSPLTAILGMAELLRQDVTRGDLRELVSGIRDGAERMKYMIDSSLDLFRMEEGTYRPRPELQDLGRIVQDAVAELRTTADNCGVETAVVVEKDVCVRGERVHLLSLVSNLVKNAVEASPPGQKVTVSVTGAPEPGVTVHNFGLVPEEVRPMLFLPYATCGKSDGTGLGLFGARLIARAHGGDIRWQSCETEGTTFVAVFPVAADEQSPAARER